MSLEQESKAERAMRQMLNDTMTEAPTRKLIRPRNLDALTYRTYEVLDEGQDFYVARDGLVILALPKKDWEESPMRIVWRDVTKEVTDSHGGVMFHQGDLIRLHKPDFQITIKRRFEVPE